MQEVQVCPECRVPEIITGEHVWLNNGVIVQKRSRGSRLAFVECENFDPLFKSTGEIIGLPIERLVFHISSRENRVYLAHLIPQDIKDQLRSMKPGDEVLGEQCRKLFEASNKGMTLLAAVMGCGRYDVKSFRYERDSGDYAIIWVSEPYSVPLVAGTLSGDIGAFIGGEVEVGWREISPDLVEFVSFRSAFDEELKERLKLEEYTHREGDIELERCATCGGPAMLADYRWDVERGIITNTSTARRMIMQGSYMLDPLFEEMEAELGEAVPRAVVEAQRRFVKAGFISVKEVRDQDDMRAQLAVRGLGNLREIEVGRKGARVRIDDVSMCLMVVGLIQGLFEMAFDADSHVEWELSKENDLSVEVTPKGRSRVYQRSLAVEVLPETTGGWESKTED